MNEVLEKKAAKIEKDFRSCVFELPRDFAVSNGLPENSFAILTLNNGKVETEVFSPSDVDAAEIDEFIKEFEDFNEEMKRIGD